MNTTPTTSDSLPPPYLILGGRKKRFSRGTVSLVVLNRSERLFIPEILKSVKQGRFDEIILVEGPGISYDTETLVLRFPDVRFLLFQKAVNIGEMVNISIGEAGSEYVCVFWSDMHLAPPGLSPEIVKRYDPVLCRLPRLSLPKGEVIPSMRAPAFYRKRLKILPVMPVGRSSKSLYPFDYCGLYHREYFQQTGGFDITMENPFWQKVDFGFRAYLWGNRMLYESRFRVQYQHTAPSEDETVDNDYKIFFLKNLALRFNGSSAHIPPLRFLKYWFGSGSGLINAIKEFRLVSRWIDKNKYLFQDDAKGVTELWDMQE